MNEKAAARRRPQTRRFHKTPVLILGLALGATLALGDLAPIGEAFCNNLSVMACKGGHPLWPEEENALESRKSLCFLPEPSLFLAGLAALLLKRRILN